MGDLQTDQGESLDLQFVPVSEFERLRAAPAHGGRPRPRVRGPGPHQHAVDDRRRVVGPHRHQLQLARDHELAVPQRAARSGPGPRRLRHLLLVEGARRAGALRGADRPGPAAGRACCTSCGGWTACPATRTSRRRTSRRTPGRSAWASRRPRAWRWPTGCTGRPRRIFVLTGDGELQEGQFWESLASAANRGLGEIVGDRRPQQDPVRHVGARGQRPRRPGGQVPRVRLARRAGATATTSRRSSATFRSLDAVTDRPKVDHRRHGEGPRRAASWKGPALKAGELYGYHSGAPSEPSTRPAWRSCWRTANARFAGAGSGRGCAPRRRMRNPRREPRQTDNLVAAYERALVAQGERSPNLLALDADLIKDCGLVVVRASGFPSASSSAASPSRTWCRWPAAWRAAARCRSCTRSPASWRRGRTSRSTTSAASARRSIYVGSLAGLLPGGPGHSHQSVRDISALAAVPHLRDGRADAPRPRWRRSSTRS